MTRCARIASVLAAAPWLLGSVASVARAQDAAALEEIHTVAAALRVLLNEHEIDDAAIDRGVPTLVWPAEVAPDGLAASAPTPQAGAPDGRVSTAEVFQAVLALEVDVRFGAAPLVDEVDASVASPSDARLYRRILERAPAYRAPWLVDDGDPATESDRELRIALDRIVDVVRANGAEQGLPVGAAASQPAELDALLRSLARSRIHGGLGLFYTWSDHYLHRDATRAYTDGLGDCNAFAFVFYALARRAGLEATFIHIGARRSIPTAEWTVLDHVGVAVRRAPSAAWVPCDPSQQHVLSESLYEWYAVEPVEMLANHFRNRAVAEVVRRHHAARLLRAALALAPAAFDIVHDVAWFQEYVLGSSSAAAPLWRRAAELNPSQMPAWSVPVLRAP